MIMHLKLILLLKSQRRNRSLLVSVFSVVMCMIKITASEVEQKKEIGNIMHNSD